jgi:type IV pilus assembly protein PilV
MKLTRSRQKGVMLLEALIGILIFSIGVLALIAMQSVAISQIRNSEYRNEAGIFADRMMGELVLSRSVAAATSSGVVSRWATEVANTLPGGNATVVQTASALGPQVTVTITWRAPAASADSSHVTVSVLKYND